MIQQEIWLNEAVLPPAFIVLGNIGDEANDTNTEMKKRLDRREQITGDEIFEDQTTSNKEVTNNVTIKG